MVEIDAEKQHFRTKGDANDIQDGAPVHFKNLIGKPAFAIPYLGYVSSFIQNPPGMYVTIAAVAVVILLAFLPDIKLRLPARKEETETPEQQAALAENARLKEELEALKAQLEEKNSEERG